MDQQLDKKIQALAQWLYECAKLDLGGRHGLLNMSDLAGTDDGRCQSRLMNQAAGNPAVGGPKSTRNHSSSVKNDS